MQVKKYLVLGALFILPLTIYIFFASGKDNFGRLPVLTETVNDLTQFKEATGAEVTLKDQITVLGFFGNNPLKRKGNAFNLAHKIYKKNIGFHDFQFIFIAEDGAQENVSELKKELQEVVDPDQWKFAFGKVEEIQKLFSSLKTNYTLEDDNSSPYVFIIDKELNLRGRNDDEDSENGILYGFDATNYSIVNNKMSDDIKVILAEYRLALKKYKANREI